MKERNGVKIYDRNDPQIPAEFKNIRLQDIRFIYGLKKVVEGGETYWVPGSREDKAELESKLKGKKVSEPDKACFLYPAPNCAGTCNLGTCNLVSFGLYYSCSCT
jgi:hypothetical protein